MCVHARRFGITSGNSSKAKFRNWARAVGIWKTNVVPNNAEPSQGHPFKFVHVFHEAIEGFCETAAQLWDALEKAKAEGDPAKDVDKRSRKMFIGDCEKWLAAVSLFLRNWSKEA